MTFKGVKPIIYGGREVWPLVEGGKGVAVSNHMSSGAWAAAGGIGTVSAVNADSYDAMGNPIPQIYHGRTRAERHEELIAYAIDGAVEQVKRAFEIAGGKGAININVLWEMGGAQRVLHGVLERTKGMINGVTCGAGMPYKLSEIAAQYGVYYLPIVSSGRAFRALWKRAYSKAAEWLAAVVYEDPWLAGGHNGLSNAEDPTKPEDPYPRVKALRDTMREGGISDDVPIVMAGGVGSRFWPMSRAARPKQLLDLFEDGPMLRTRITGLRPSSHASATWPEVAPWAAAMRSTTPPGFARSPAAISRAAVSGIGVAEGTSTSPVLSTTMSPTAILSVIALAKAFWVIDLVFLTTLVG